MMKTLLLATFATLAYAASENKDVPIEKCAVSIDGVKRPSVLPSLCKNTYADIPCAHLYAVADNSSHQNASKDFVVSSRCYKGPLQPYAHLCSSQCALCCEQQDYNCTDKLPKQQCQLFAQYGLCGEVDLYDFLNYNCRQSCALCKQPEFNKTICKDSFQHCRMLFHIVPCSNPFMMQNCEGTCFITEKCGSTFTPATTKKPSTPVPSTLHTAIPSTSKKP